MTTTQTAASFTTKAEREAHYRAQLASSPRWALRALAILYSLQTADEQAIGATREHNGAGFTGRDAEILSSFARQVEAWNAEATHKYATPLSPKQQVLLFRMMPKYAVQLIAHLEQTGAIPAIGRKEVAPEAIIPRAAVLSVSRVLPAAAIVAEAERQEREAAKPAPRRTPQLPPISSADVAEAAARVEARRTAPTVRMPAAPVDLVALASRIQA